RDAYYSNNISHIDHVIQVFTSLYREFYLLDHLTNILVSNNYFQIQYDRINSP
ncbi:unnamed protein product, partial [Rotaria magnacalcarata]